jgi:DNA-binding transcriptional LysR family regulator
MELRQPHYFVTLAEELHFLRAADRLHSVQPAVSRLEAEAGRHADRPVHAQVAITQA